jgi:hypothetical protein
VTPAEELAEVARRELALVLGGADPTDLPDDAERRAALVAASDPADPALRRAAETQALVTVALRARRDEVAAQLKRIGPTRTAAQAYARSARI